MTILAMGRWFTVAALLLAHGTFTKSRAENLPPNQSRLFERDVLPILNSNCLKCHGDVKRKGGLDLRTATSVMRGGTDGPVVIKGSAEKSSLFRQVVERRMPPDKAVKLSEAEIRVFREWIDAGAPVAGRSAAGEFASTKDRNFWSFRVLGRPVAPTVVHRDRLRSPIDAFILAKLEEKGLSFSADADPLVLLRRAYLDLIGLPPSPQEIEGFLKDKGPRAYERLLDRLLASEHFGERWGRHWLDEAGYVDVRGVDNDAATVKLSEDKWKYRDYVVRAFNRDTPYGRFVTEQLAGDEMVDWRGSSHWTFKVMELLTATGFLRTAPDDTDERELNTLDLHHEILQRTSEVVASCLLGLTVNCAKCHDHKYEPISQRDYYRFKAIFATAFNPQAWLTPPERGLPALAPKEKVEIERRNLLLDQQVEKLRRQIEAIRQPYEQELLEGRLKSLPQEIRADTKAAVDLPADKRNEVQQYLAAKFAATLQVRSEEVRTVMKPVDNAKINEYELQISSCNKGRRTWGLIQAVYDVGQPGSGYVLRRGNLNTPGEKVEPGSLSVLCASEAAASLPRTPTGVVGSSGRRLALARQLTDWQTPAGALVARVRVNRIWQHLFGRGIVETTGNLGESGTPPTHPELLEWLASELIANGGRTKPIINLIMTSTVYRQASTQTAKRSDNADRPNPNQIDADNSLLWHMRLRRLESEIIRDSLLAVGGNLDCTIGGPPLPVESRSDGMFIIKTDGLPTSTSKWRRSLYLLARRNYHPTLLGVFDQPVIATNCTCRMPSAVVLQSLTMLNDVFVIEQAERLAKRVVTVAGETQEQQIGLAYRIVLARDPKPQEVSWCKELYRRQAERFRSTNHSSREAELEALVHVCHVLLNTTEFLYVS